MNVKKDCAPLAYFLNRIQVAKTKFEQMKNKPLRFDFIYTLFQALLLYRSVDSVKYKHLLSKAEYKLFSSSPANYKLFFSAVQDKLAGSVATTFICTSWALDNLKSIHKSYNLINCATKAQLAAQCLDDQVHPIGDMTDPVIRSTALVLQRTSTRFYEVEAERARNNFENKIKEFACTISVTLCVLGGTKSYALSLIALKGMSYLFQKKDNDNPHAENFNQQLRTIQDVANVLQLGAGAPVQAAAFVPGGYNMDIQPLIPQQ